MMAFTSIRNGVSMLFASESSTLPTTSPVNPGHLSRRGLIKACQGKGQGRVIAVLNDPYDPISNPNGYVNLGVAENRLMLHRVQEYINKNLHIPENACSYGTGGTGSPRLKKAMAALWNDRFRPHDSVKQQDIQFSSGCGAICEMLGWTLGDEGDAVILSAPIYGAFTPNFTFKAGLKLVHVSTHSDDPVGLQAPTYYERRIQSLRAQGVRPRIILICNPHNPLGKCYHRDTLVAFCRLAAKFDMHLISDEVFALSTFDPTPTGAVPFTSVLSIAPTEHDLSRERIHVLYGFSKDVAGAGLRLGCLITRNEELRFATGAMSPMHWPSSLTDTAIAQIIENRPWLDAYISESQSLLSVHYRLATRTLDHAGIQFSRGVSAGFFVWIDLSPFMGDASEDNSAEALLADKLYENRVWVNSGESFSSDKPGWFRVVFTLDKTVLKEGLRRLVEVVQGHEIAEKAIRSAFS